MHLKTLLNFSIVIIPPFGMIMLNIKLKKEEYEINEDAQFYLFLLKQCFTSRNRYYRKFIGGKYVHDWWAICHIQNRNNKKDMKSKGVCSIKNENGKNIFILYFIDDSEQGMD